MIDLNTFIERIRLATFDVAADIILHLEEVQVTELTDLLGLV